VTEVTEVFVTYGGSQGGIICWRPKGGGLEDRNIGVDLLDGRGWGVKTKKILLTTRNKKKTENMSAENRLKGNSEYYGKGSLNKNGWGGKGRKSTVRWGERGEIQGTGGGGKRQKETRLILTSRGEAKGEEKGLDGHE